MQVKLGTGGLLHDEGSQGPGQQAQLASAGPAGGQAQRTETQLLPAPPTRL
jgi:hypothetical protein